MLNTSIEDDHVEIGKVGEELLGPFLKLGSRSRLVKSPAMQTRMAFADLVELLLSASSDDDFWLGR